MWTAAVKVVQAICSSRAWPDAASRQARFLVSDGRVEA
jgi:hypothetical protein